MEWLKTLVPALGTAIAGPLGGAAAAFIADKLGVSDKTVEGVTEALSNQRLDPNQIAQLKLAEIEFKKFLETNKIDLARLDVDNTKDARDMQKTTRAFTPALLTYGITLGFFGILSSMLIYDYKPTEALLIMLGALGAAFGSAVNFWLGSSHGSMVKTDALRNK
jgi:hypothetical protein